ncbi:MAG TPA: hypothetical protein VMT95_01400 [Candidatus Binatia bacterium]|nr:hypothetical protein [Candidatus Binatia bacterium]
MTSSTGVVTKDVDTLVTNHASHGPVPFLSDPESRPPARDPLYVKLDFKPTSIRRLPARRQGRMTIR